MLEWLRKIFVELVWKYCFTRSKVHIQMGGIFKADKSVEIKNSFVFVDKKSKLIIQDGVVIDNMFISITNGGVLTIGRNCILRKGRNMRTPEIIIDSGKMELKGNDLIQCDRIWVRWNGSLSIGEYTNINSESEIRCDECIDIGAFSRISYNVRIWDTNTHQILSFDVIKRSTINDYPNVGRETEKPKTKPVCIGQGCWIGEKASIMKGTQLGDEVNVGFNTQIIGKSIPSGCSVVQDLNLKIFKSEISSIRY